jgi:hypothetical protein
LPKDGPIKPSQDDQLYVRHFFSKTTMPAARTTPLAMPGWQRTILI